jgi:hypothetical protein
MLHERVELMSGNVHHQYSCPVCRYREREIRSRRGALLSWRNLTLLAAQASRAV